MGKYGDRLVTSMSQVRCIALELYQGQTLESEPEDMRVCDMGTGVQRQQTLPSLSIHSLIFFRKSLSLHLQPSGGEWVEHCRGRG